jgi:hypothetical protein
MQTTEFPKGLNEPSYTQTLSTDELKKVIELNKQHVDKINKHMNELSYDATNVKDDYQINNIYKQELLEDGGPKHRMVAMFKKSTFNQEQVQGEPNPYSGQLSGYSDF